MKKIKELQEKIKEKRKGRKLTQKGIINRIVDGIPKQYRGIFDYGVKKLKNDIEVWCEIIPEKEKEMYNSFGKRVIFTNNKAWTSLQIVRTYNSKSLIEDDFKWLNDKIVMPLKPYFVRKDITIKAHVFYV